MATNWSGDILPTSSDTAYIDNGGTDNFLRLDGGYIALFGDQTAYVADLIDDGYIQLWDGSQWVTAEAGDIHFAYFSNDAVGEAAAEEATGYSGLGGYTVASTQAVPEPHHRAARRPRHGRATAAPQAR